MVKCVITIYSTKIEVLYLTSFMILWTVRYAGFIYSVTLHNYTPIYFGTVNGKGLQLKTDTTKTCVKDEVGICAQTVDAIL